MNIEAYKLFKALDDLEKKRLGQLVKSEKKKGVKKLFDIFKNHSNGELDKEYVKKKLGAKGREFNDLTSKMNKLIENFIVFNELTTNDNNDSEATIQRELLLLNYLRKKPEGENIDELFKTRARRLEKELNNIIKHDSFYYINLYKIRHYLYHAMSIDRFKSKDAEPKVIDILDSIDMFYVVSKLHYCAEAKVRQNMFGEDIPLIMQDETYQLSQLEHINNTSATLTKIYRLLLDAFQDANTENLTQIKNEIVENSNHIGQHEIAGMLTILLHHIARAVREGNTEVYEVGYETLKHGLENGCFVWEGILNYRVFCNYVSYCLKVEKENEIGDALKKYSEFIHPNKRDQTSTLCLGYQLYGQKNYFQAYQQLKSIKGTSDVFLIVHIKLLQLKCLYEFSKFSYKGQQPDKFLHEFCPDFKRYFINKFQDNAKPYIKFIDFLLKLENINNSQERLIQLLDSEEYDMVFDRAWLLLQIKKK